MMATTTTQTSRVIHPLINPTAYKAMCEHLTSEFGNTAFIMDCTGIPMLKIGTEFHVEEEVRGITGANNGKLLQPGRWRVVDHDYGTTSCGLRVEPLDGQDGGLNNYFQLGFTAMQVVNGTRNVTLDQRCFRSCKNALIGEVMESMK